MANGQNPVVSVIVPARNEEACLALCLESLVSQTGIGFEIIVVDDASTDRTAEIAGSFATDNRGAVVHTHASDSGTTGKDTISTRADLDPAPDNDGTAGSRALPVRGERNISKNCLAVTVIPAPPLLDNWTGKNNAMSTGAKVATGKWLLFTDADTVHKPGSLARAVAEAKEHGGALLSYSPEQEVRTFWEKAVMPVIFAELAATYPPKKVNDPASPIAAANGQYLMISRETYDAVGGHTKIAGDLLEDVAMARLVKSSGRKIFFRYGGDAVRTRMYRSWPQMKEGWTKNLALLFTHPLARACMLLAFWVVTWAAFGLGWSVIASGYWRGAVYLLALVFLYARIAWGRFPPKATALAVAFGIPIAAYLLLRSASFHKNSAVTWKGRAYRTESA